MSAGRKTVLIIDDDKLVQRTFRIVLERQGYAVLTAGDGNEGLALLGATKVDAILLDILMPDKEGLETLIEIKRRRPNLPVIVISGGGAQSKLDFLAAAEKFGADAVLKKPVTPQQIVSTLAAHISAA